jgi:hypothetical protein
VPSPDARFACKDAGEAGKPGTLVAARSAMTITWLILAAFVLVLLDSDHSR